MAEGIGEEISLKLSETAIEISCYAVEDSIYVIILQRRAKLNKGDGGSFLKRLCLLAAAVFRWNENPGISKEKRLGSDL
jgi:hypothetical protein